MPSKPRKPRKLTIYQKIVARHLAHKKDDVPKNFWPAQTKAAKQLLEIVPDEEFWLECEPPGDKINSLHWFLTEWGRRYIKEQQALIEKNKGQRRVAEFLKQKNESQNKGTEIPVEDYGIKRKPQNIWEFLNTI